MSSTSSTPFSRRRYARYQIEIPLLVTVYRPGTILRIHGRFRDIGESGIRAVLSGEVRPGERVDLEFTLPNAAEKLRMRAGVRYQADDQCGFEFLSLTSEQRQMLQALTQSSGVHAVNREEHEVDVAAPSRGGVVVCASCGAEYSEEEHFCILCGTPAVPPPPPEPETIQERIPSKLVRPTTWIPKLRPTASHYAGYKGSRGNLVDSAVAIVFLITLCIGLWQWLFAPTESGHNARSVDFSMEDVLVRLGSSTPPERVGSATSSGSIADRSFISVAAQPIVGFNAPPPRRNISVGEPGSGSAERKLSRHSLLPQPTRSSNPAPESSEPPKPSPSPSRRGRVNGPMTEASSSRNAATEQPSGSSLQSMLLEKVLPTYPARAQQEQVEGEVVLQALIAKDGTIADLRPISGPQVLSDAAMNAVKKWRFKPYMVNGKPVEVQTNIRVNFALPQK